MFEPFGGTLKHGGRKVTETSVTGHRHMEINASSFSARTV